MGDTWQAREKYKNCKDRKDSKMWVYDMNTLFKCIMYRRGPPEGTKLIELLYFHKDSVIWSPWPAGFLT